MSEELHGTVAKKMEELGPGVTVAMQIKIDAYFDVVRGLVDDFASRKGLKCIYVTCSVPAASLENAFKALEVNASDLSFVDCISQSLMGEMQRREEMTFVESPSMLENIVLKVDYLMRRAGDKKSVVIFDSFNSFAIHNDSKMLLEFFTIAMNMLKAREAYPVLIALPEQLRPEAKDTLPMICDMVLTFDSQAP